MSSGDRRHSSSQNLPDSLRSRNESCYGMTATFDIVVIGAGPGGIAAAVVAAESGMRVCLIDDNRSPGGQIWRGLHQEDAQKRPHGSAFLHWVKRLRRTNCEVLSGWQAIDQLQTQCIRLERDDKVRDVLFQKLILATGARERFLPFPGWTLPGVFGVGGLQALVKSGLDPRGQRTVIAGTGPLLLAVAAGLSDAGARIGGIFEQAPLSQLLQFGFSLAAYPAKLIEGAQYRRKVMGSPYRSGCWIQRADGDGRVERVTATNGRKAWTVPCDWLACGFNLVPNLELPRLLGCRIADGYVAVDSFQQSSVPGIACVGEVTGIGGMEKALLEGEVAAWVAAGRDAEARATVRRLTRHANFARKLDRAFALRDELRRLAEPDTLVCRCEDVPYSDLARCDSWREAKLHMRCGMGACQGRVCATAAEALFGWQCGGGRPPVFPAAVSTLAAKTESSDSGQA
jgi:D-hydroxyproline dehydrogenase subunit alpha